MQVSATDTKKINGELVQKEEYHKRIASYYFSIKCILSK